VGFCPTLIYEIGKKSRPWLVVSSFVSGSEVKSVHGFAIACRSSKYPSFIARHLGIQFAQQIQFEVMQQFKQQERSSQALLV
jgi:hypothetical protein